MKNIIIGYSGHAYVVIESAMRNEVTFKAYCDLEKRSNNPYSLQFLGEEKDRLIDGNKWFIGLGDNLKRASIFNKFKTIGEVINVIDKCAVISSTAILGRGVFIGPNATVNALSLIGDGVIVNSGSIIEHDCRVNDFAHIAPGAVLFGNVSVGKQSFIGANAVLKQGVTIGDDVTIGMGAVVTKDILDPGVYVGSPARKL